MKKVLFIAFTLLCTTYSFAQLTEGKYKIVSVKGFVNGKTVYENFFEENEAIIRVTPKLINIVIAGYSAHTYSVEKPSIVEGGYLYEATKIQSGTQTKLLSQRLEEHPEIDGGILMVRHSDDYADIFYIFKED